MTTNGTLAVAAIVLALACGSAPGEVSEATWTDGPWPLTVDAGRLSCDRLGAVWIEANGVQYPLNGVAISDTERNPSGRAPLENIWRRNPNGGGIRVNIGPLADRVRALCD